MKKMMQSAMPQGECDGGYQEYPYVFLSEVEALRQMLPSVHDFNGIELCNDNRHFARALGIKKCLASLAEYECISRQGHLPATHLAEHLPYPDQSLDYVLMASCICLFNDLHVAFSEAFRVLKHGGVLVVGFIDRNSEIGRLSQDTGNPYPFLKGTNVFSVEKVAFELNLANFKNLNFIQTLFRPLQEIKHIEAAKPGYGQGSFTVIQAIKS